MFQKAIVTAAAVVAMSGAAFAADLPTQKGPPAYAPPPPVFTWTGVYVGGQVGYQWGRDYGLAYSPTGAAIGATVDSPNGVTGGAHIGYNYQFAGPFVVGLEGDVNGLSYTGSNVVATPTSGILVNRTQEIIDGSVRGRIGYSWNRALIYTTGGVAFGSFHDPNNLGDALNATSVGWTAGGGIEYAIDNNWSIRAEYRYTQFGRYYGVDPNLNAAFFGAVATVSDRQIENKVQAGFSYKFDLMGAPILAKY